MAATAARRRSHLPHRAAIRFDTRADLLSGLESVAKGSAATGCAIGRPHPDRVSRLAFVFTGQGSQWAGMGSALMAQEPVFREAMERCAAQIDTLAGGSLLDDLARPAETSPLDRTDRAQAGIFTIQYAMTTLLAHYGVTPDCVVGHSCGELAAFQTAGVISLEQACRLVVDRGACMEAAADALGEPGAMVAVQVSRADSADLLGDGLEIAAINSPNSVVLAGPTSAVDAAVDTLSHRSIPHRRLDVAFAFHSRQMDRAAVDFAARAGGMKIGAGGMEIGADTIAVYAAAWGRRMPAGPLDDDYWRANLREPVLFADAVTAMRDDGTTHFLEIGPHPSLSGPMMEILEGVGSSPVIAGTMRRDQGRDQGPGQGPGHGRDAVLDGLAALYVTGFDLRWDRLHPAAPALADAPLYPWRRRRLWPRDFDPWTPRQATADAPGLDGLRYDLVWDQLPAPADRADGRPAAVLLLATPDNPVARALAERLDVPIRDSRRPDAVDAALKQTTDAPIVLVPDPAGADSHPPTAQRTALDLALRVIGHLSRGPAPSAAFWIVTTQTQEPGLESPGLDSLWALMRTATTEDQGLDGRCLELAAVPTAGDLDLLARLLAAPPEGERGLAIRGSAAHAARLATTPARPAERSLPVRSDATYLVTGGCGSLGLVLSRALVDLGARSVVLLGRSGADEAARTAIAEMEAMAVRVLVRPCDIADPASLAAVFDEIDRSLPPLAGVIHAAGVLADAGVAGLDGETLGRVLAPKIDGGWTLHLATRARRLDFFIALSSAALLLGSPGQAAYGAANGFLDALAAYRQRIGLPSLSLRLGLVEGSTMLRRAREGGRDFAADGIRPISAARVAAALPVLWSGGRPVETLLDLDAAAWLERYPGAAMRAYLSPLLPETAPEEVPEETIRRLGTGPEALRALTADLTAIVARVTGTPAADLAGDRPLRELGVDSLMTMQIRRAILSRFGRDVRVTAFWAHPTLDRFARHLAGEIGIAIASPKVVDANGTDRAKADPTDRADVRRALADKWDKYL